MARPSLANIDPLQIFMHALGFHVAENALGSLTLTPNTQLAAQVVQPTMVLSAFITELFLKCLICLETTLTPQGHHLFELFEQLKPATQDKIIHFWNTHIVPVRDPEWKFIENSQYGGAKKFKRDLPVALSDSSRAFEKIRYSYEPNSQDGDFNIGDLPRVLRRVILEMKPEWASLGRDVKAVGLIGYRATKAARTRMTTPDLYPHTLAMDRAGRRVDAIPCHGRKCRLAGVDLRWRAKTTRTAAFTRIGRETASWQRIRRLGSTCRSARA
jgi:hypothetical protein